MRRLFWKFFLAYWLALIIAVGGIVAYWVADQVRGPLETSPGAILLVDAASAALRYGGEPALQADAAEPTAVVPWQVRAVDASGREVLGRPVPPAALAEARRVADAGAAGDIVQRVASVDGTPHLLFVPREPMTWRQRWQLFRGTPPRPLIPLVTGILVSLVVGAVLAWHVTRPVRHLRTALAALSAGRLDTRVSPHMGRRRDELALLARDFDSTAQQLQALVGAQRNLLHDVSHELRSPLARLQAAIGLARQDRTRVEDSLSRIEREAERLDDLVGQLLTLSRLEARGPQDAGLPADPLDLADLVASIAADADFEARAMGRRVTCTVPEQATIAGQVPLLHRAIENVVRNAVRLTAEGTAVDVGLAPAHSGQGFVVTVSDRGPGVSNTDLPSLFDPFFRGAGAPSGSGFGLGLAITRRAIEAHGGQVRALNRPGGGLMVELELPSSAGAAVC